MSLPNGITRFSRRTFLAQATLGAGALLMAACSAPPAATNTPAPAAAKPTAAPTTAAAAAPTTAAAKPTAAPTTAAAAAPTTAAAKPTAAAPTAATAAKPTAAAVPTSARKPGQKVTLTYWTGWNGIDLEKQTKTTIEPFNKDHPDIEVKIQTIFGQYQKVLTAIAAGEPPDVVSAVWTSQLAALAARGAIQPLDDFFKASNLKATDYFQNQFEQWHYKAKLYGLAITTNSTMYGYNKTLVQAAGLDVEKPPKSIADLDLWAEKLTKLDDKGNFKQIGFRPSGLWLWGHVFGANFYDEGTQKITANEPKMIEALDWIASYGKKWDIKKIEAFESGFGSYAGATNPFLTGQQASLMVGEWMIEYAKAFKPELEPNIGYVPAPYPSGGRENVTTFGGSTFVIPKGVKYPDASWEFIRYIQDPQIGGTFARAIANLQPINATRSDPRFISDPRIKLGLDLLAGKNAYGVIPIPVFEMYSTELGKAESFVLHGEKKSKEALDDVTSLIQSELDLVNSGGSGR